VVLGVSKRKRGVQVCGTTEYIIETKCNGGGMMKEVGVKVGGGANVVKESRAGDV
jgi:hypothetical protein